MNASRCEYPQQPEREPAPAHLDPREPLDVGDERRAREVDPFANIKDPAGSGFQVLATCTNPNEKDPAKRVYAPSGDGGVAAVWARINGQQALPEGSPSIALYANTLGTVQVGGQRLPDVPHLGPNGLPDGTMMQNPQWVATVGGVSLRL